jgi:hypothetical protein
MFKLSVDKKGGLRSIDGLGMSWNISGTVVPTLNMDSVITANVAKDQIHPHTAIVNKLDSVQTTIGGAVIRIRYSRPSIRGRVIFSGVVEYKEENDVLRVPMSVGMLPQSVELLTIAVVPADKGGKIEVSWDKLRASVAFTTFGQ